MTSLAPKNMARSLVRDAIASGSVVSVDVNVKHWSGDEIKHFLDHMIAEFRNNRSPVEGIRAGGSTFAKLGLKPTSASAGSYRNIHVAQAELGLDRLEVNFRSEGSESS